jgi:hypothetical protein
MWSLHSKLFKAATPGKPLARSHQGRPLRPRLEQLEDRVTPAVVFNPVFGVETTKQDNGAVLNSAPVYLIFWGSYWSTHPTDVANVRAAAGNVLSSAYLSGLQQYHSDGIATLNSSIAFFTGFEPDNLGFNGSNVDDVVQDRIDNSVLPESDGAGGQTPIYAVITPPDIQSSEGTNVVGFNQLRHDVDVGFLSVDNDDIPEVWSWTGNNANGTVNINRFSLTFSHEIAELMSDTGGGGYKINPGAQWTGGGDDQIGDNEGNKYAWREPNGALVQPFWSRSDQGWLAEDGNAYRVNLNPIWGNGINGPSWTGQAALVVNGGQLPFRLADTITIDTAPGGGVQVTLDGEVTNFPANFIARDSSGNGITINLGDTVGSTVNVRNLPANLPLTIHGGGDDTVNIGANGSVQGILSKITINNPAHSNVITLDDSADRVARTVTMASSTSAYGSVVGLAPGEIDYSYLDTAALTVKTGAGGDIVNVLATGSATSLVGNGAATVNVGNAGHTAGIARNLTLDNTPSLFALTVDDSAGPPDIATLSTFTPPGDSDFGEVSGLSQGDILYEYADTRSVTVKTPSGGTVFVGATGAPTTVLSDGATIIDVANFGVGGIQGIRGHLTFENPRAFDTITIDDSQDTAARTATLDTFTPAHDSAFGSVVGLTPAEIDYELADTRSLTLATGAGGGVVNVHATGVPTTLNGNGAATVNVGNAGSVQGVHGTLTLDNPPALYTLTVDDSADRARRTVTLGSFVPAGDTEFGFVRGLAPADIDYEFIDTNSVTVKTGSGGDVVNVLATYPATTLVGNGRDTVNVGNGSVQNVRGNLTLTNPASFDTLTVDDSADSTARTVTVDTAVLSDGFQYGVLTGLSPGTIEYRAADMNAPVTIQTGTGGSTVDVYRTPGGFATDLVGHGADTVNVGLAGSVQGILGAVDVRNPPAFTTLNVDDSADPAGHTVTITNAAVTGLAPAAITFRQIDLKALSVTGSQGASTYDVLSTFNHSSAHSDVTTLTARGPTVVNVGDAGSVQGIRGALVLLNPPSFNAVTVDDSADPTGRTATLDTTTLADGFLYGTIAGLAPGTIEYRAADTAAPVHVLGGPGGNTFRVNSTTVRAVNLDTGTGANQVTVLANAAAVTVNAQGTDAVTVGNASHNLDGIAAPVTVQGNGQTALTVDDEANRNSQILGSLFRTTRPTFTVTDALVSRHNVVTLSSGEGGSTTTYDATVFYSGLSGLTLQGGRSGNVFNVEAAAAGTPVAVNAGAGSDTVNVGSAANSLDAIRSGLTVNGQGGVNALHVEDQGSAGREEYDVHSTQITRELITSPPTSATQTVTYSGFANITVNGADASSNQFFALGTPAGTSVSLNAGSGGFNQFLAFDEFSPTDAPPATDHLLGPLAFHGHHTNDFGERIGSFAAAGHTYTLSASGAVSTVQRDGAADLTFDGLSELILAGSNVGGNQVNVQSVAPGVFLNIVLFSGDHAVVGSLAPILGGTMEGILGTVGFTSVGPATVDLVDSGDLSSAGQRVTVAPPPPGNPNDPFATITGMSGAPGLGIFFELNPGSAVGLHGGLGDKTFALQGFLPGVALSIDGGAGSNTLDYSGWTGDVSVNLQLGTATGVDGGISNIRNVTGSIGNDLIVGDANVNVLIGGTGRNVIIGGGGPDRIVGGGGDNLLIGGTTDYDRMAAALDAIFREWLAAGEFASRMAALQTGGDLLTGTGIQLDDATVHPDGLSAVSPGPGNNWVIA